MTMKVYRAWWEDGHGWSLVFAKDSAEAKEITDADDDTTYHPDAPDLLGDPNRGEARIALGVE